MPSEGSPPTTSQRQAKSALTHLFLTPTPPPRSMGHARTPHVPAFCTNVQHRGPETGWLSHPSHKALHPSPHLAMLTGPEVASLLVAMVPIHEHMHALVVFERTHAHAWMGQRGTQLNHAPNQWLGVSSPVLPNHAQTQPSAGCQGLYFGTNHASPPASTYTAAHH